MKPFSFCKLSLVLLGFGGVLTLAPQSRAQSEVSPDHFDGTDSWAAAAAAKVPSKAKPHSAPASLQARNNKPVVPSVQPVAARDVVAPRRTDATTVNKKRKATAQKSDK